MTEGKDEFYSGFREWYGTFQDELDRDVRRIYYKL